MTTAGFSRYFALFSPATGVKESAFAKGNAYLIQGQVRQVSRTLIDDKDFWPKKWPFTKALALPQLEQVHPQHKRLGEVHAHSQSQRRHPAQRRQSTLPCRLTHASTQRSHCLGLTSTRRSHLLSAHARGLIARCSAAIPPVRLRYSTSSQPAS